MHYKKEIDELKKLDPKLAAVIDNYGPCTMEPKPNGAFGNLCSAILYQQLSGKAAATIEGRFKGLYGDKFPTPKQLLKTEYDTLREVGLSNNKALSVADLAQHCEDGQLDFDAMQHMDDVAVIEQLVQVRGIGRWTAQMFLMFTLGRLDVYPTADLGIQKAVQIVYGYKKLPAERTMHRYGNQWRPYRTLACWYLWTLVD